MPVSGCIGANHRQFRIAQGGSGVLAVPHLPVKRRHKCRGGQIVNLPQTYSHALRSCVHEGACQPHHSLTLYELPEPGLARREDNKVDAGPGWHQLIKDGVSGEMEHAISVSFSCFTAASVASRPR